jgi:hypothetical protein
VAAYLIPQVMAYAEVAGLPAVTGLWAVVERSLFTRWSGRLPSSPSVRNPVLPPHQAGIFYTTDSDRGVIRRQPPFVVS